MYRVKNLLFFNKKLLTNKFKCDILRARSKEKLTIYLRNEGFKMLKVSSKFSSKLTLVLCYIMLVFMCLFTLALPWVWYFLLRIFESGTGYYVPCLCVLYPAAALGITACVLMVQLMHRVRREEIFTAKTVSIIRGISWCCIGVTPIFFGLGFFFYIFFVISFLTAFLGLMVRVVKNVIEAATELKEENDLTV